MSNRTIIEIDPKGSWRRNRYDFCNCLEHALDSNDGRSWSVLKEMGVTKSIYAEEDANGEPRSSAMQVGK